MNQPIETQIEQCEARLKSAMLNSDVNALDELLAANLVFTNHLGRLMTKSDDLAAHRSGMLKISAISLTDKKLIIQNDVAVVSAQATINGVFQGMPSEKHYRFTRVWAKTEPGKWQVIAAHSCIVS